MVIVTVDEVVDVRLFRLRLIVADTINVHTNTPFFVVLYIIHQATNGVKSFFKKMS